MAVVGVDFGCLNAVVAQAERGGVKVLLNENSKRLNANMVSIQGKQRFLGEAAASIARSNYKNTASCLKRFLGRKFMEPEVQAEMRRLPGVTFKETEDGGVGVEVAYDSSRVTLSMPQLAAMMLFKLSQICGAQESNKGSGIAEAVVSVPCWFTNAQRLATLDACEIAGVKCLRLMHDTTATALEYGIWRSAQNKFDEAKGSRVLFVDLGYSSYQVSVVEYVRGKLAVKATAFDRTLGGRDFDLAIAQFVAAEFAAKYPGEDPLSSPKPKLKLLDACEKAKKTLSPHGVAEATMYIECLMNDRDFSLKLTLEKFESLVQPYLDRLIPPIEQVLADSATEPGALASVEIVGGGSRVASVKRTLATYLGLDLSLSNYGLSTTLNADEAVAKGCAMQAAMLSPRFKVKEYLVAEAAPFSVKVSWDTDALGGAAASTTPMDTTADDAAAKPHDDDDGISAAAESETLIFARNSETPKERRITFTKYADFSIRAAYAEPDRLPPPAPGHANAEIAEFDIKGVPPADAKLESFQKVRVHVSHTLHGTVKVETAHLVQHELVDDEPATMDTDAGAKDDAAAAKDADAKDDKPAEQPTKKKRKQKKTALVVDDKTPKMTRKAIDAAIELEAQMANADRVIQETNDMRNELEAYIYKMRDDVIGALRPYVSDADKTTFETALNDAETWLYDGDGYDTTKSNYANRLAALKALGDPVVARKRDEETRGLAVSALQEKVEHLKAWANSSDEAYAHISDADKSVVRDEATKAATWLMDLLDQQGAKQQHEDPVLKTIDIRKRLDDLASVVKPIMNKPKPKPKPEAPPPEPAPTPDASAKPTEADDKDVDMSDAAQPPADDKDVDMPDAAAADKQQPAPSA
mmetsp:Transcript_9900/g.31793  ORF Transcript_9900/g.31793 Transcript_9900/m.31793 type:complete len:868 (-) Transcript_9900:401-3004(-)